MSGHSLLSNSVEFLLTSYRSRSWEARLKHQILEEHQELNYLHAPLFLNSLLMKEKEEE